MSVIQAIALMQNTIAMNNAMYSMISAGNARMGLISGMTGGYNPSFGSLEALSALDTQYELDMISNSIRYKMAKAMQENLKKLMKEDSYSLNFLA